MQQRTSSITMLKMQALSNLHMPHSFLNLDDVTPIPSKHGIDHFSVQEQIHQDRAENFEEFGFTCIDPQGTLIFADEIFDNGQIRPIYPTIFNQSLLFTATHDNDTSHLRPPLKKLFVEQHKDFDSKSCDILKEPLNDQPSQNMTIVEVEALNECCKKSNSTGFSKLWRFRRDLKLRSSSDGKDAFVSFNPPVPTESNKTKGENITVKKRKVGKNKTLSAHEKFYLANRMRKESNKQKSFLPYKQQLLGLFTNVNGLSRNLHPF